MCKAWLAWTAHLLLTAALRWCWHPHFPDEETQDDRGRQGRARRLSVPGTAMGLSSASQLGAGARCSSSGLQRLPWRDLGVPEEHASPQAGGNSLGFRPLLFLGPGGPQSPALGLWGLTQVPQPLSGTWGSGLQFQPKMRFLGWLCAARRGFPGAVRKPPHIGSGRAPSLPPSARAPEKDTHLCRTRAGGGSCTTAVSVRTREGGWRRTSPFFSAGVFPLPGSHLAFGCVSA